MSTRGVERVLDVVAAPRPIGAGGLAVVDEPFRWACGVIEPLLAATLTELFPLDGLRQFRSTGGSKAYLNESRTVVDEARDVDDLDQLPGLWREFVGDITQAGYRAGLGDRLGIDLRGTAVECRLVRHASGGHIGPHTDREDKHVTQLWYFAPGPWDTTWGGRLQLLGSSDPDDVACSIVPESGTTVVLARSDSSWHAVEAVSDESRHPRLSLLAHFCAPHPTGRDDA